MAMPSDFLNKSCAVRVLLLAATQLPDIKLPCRQEQVWSSNTRSYLELLSFKNVAICAAALARSAGDRCVQTPCNKLLLQKGVHFGICGTVSLSQQDRLSFTLLPLLELA